MLTLLRYVDSQFLVYLILSLMGTGFTLTRIQFLPVIAALNARGLATRFISSFFFLQVQHKNALYKGTFDAFHKILKYEGVKGLYRGFWISCFQVSLPKIIRTGYF
jgi:hypothetical protein